MRKFSRCACPVLFVPSQQSPRRFKIGVFEP